jgi:hypothetical protein
MWLRPISARLKAIVEPTASAISPQLVGALQRHVEQLARDRSVATTPARPRKMKPKTVAR